jgi:hypothetical protein
MFTFHAINELTNAKSIPVAVMRYIGESLILVRTKEVRPCHVEDSTRAPHPSTTLLLRVFPKRINSATWSTRPGACGAALGSLCETLSRLVRLGRVRSPLGRSPHSASHDKAPGREARGFW